MMRVCEPSMMPIPRLRTLPSVGFIEGLPIPPFWGPRKQMDWGYYPVGAPTWFPQMNASVGGPLMGPVV